MVAPAVRRACAGLSACVVVALPAFAEAASTIPEIVVTPNYTPVPIDRMGSTVSVIESGKLTRTSSASVAQLLRAVPGVTVIESGGPGGSSEVRLRGAETGHTVVLIDGVRVNDPATARGDFDFVLLSLNDVEHVEVLRGPQSAVYGSDAMGGVINIVTRKQRTKSALTATVEGGSYGTLNESAAGGITTGDFALRFSGTHLSSEGFSRRGNREHNEHDAAEKTSGSLRLTYEPANGPKLEASVTGTWQASAYDGTSTTVPSKGADAVNTATRRQVSGFAKITLPTWEGWLDQSFTAFAMTSDRRNLEPLAAPPTAQFTATNFGGEYQAVGDLAAAGMLTLGARVEQEHARNAAQTSVSFPGFDRTRTYFAGYGEHQITVLDNLHLTLSGRYDGETGGPGFLTGRATAAYEFPAAGTILRASVGTGAKRPTGYQIGNNLFAAAIAPPGTAVNTSLRPEKSVGYDAGVEQTLFGGAVHLSATAFYNRFADLLGFTFLPSSSVNGYYDNIDRARTSGLEFAIEAQAWPDVLTASATYTWMPTRNLVTGRALPRRPLNSGSFSLTFTPDPAWEMTLTGTLVGKRLNTASASVMLPAYTRLDAYTAYAISQHTKLFARVENVTDTRYEDPLGYNATGQALYVGLTWKE